MAAGLGWRRRIPVLAEYCRLGLVDGQEGLRRKARAVVRHDVDHLAADP